MFLTTMALLGLYIISIRAWNGPGFMLTPIGLQAIFLSAGIAVPAAIGYQTQDLFGVGLNVLSINVNTLVVLDVGIAFLMLGAASSAIFQLIWNPQRPLPQAPEEDLSRAQKAFRLFLLSAGTLTLIFLLQHAEAYIILFNALRAGSSDVFTLVQSNRINVLFGSTWAIQGFTRILPFCILLQLSAIYAKHSRGGVRIIIVLAAIEVVGLTLLSIRGIQVTILLECALLHQYFRPLPIKRVFILFFVVGAFLLVATALKFGYGLQDSTLSSASAIYQRTLHRVGIAAEQLDYIIQIFPHEERFALGGTYLRDAISLIPSPIKHRIFPPRYWMDFNGFLYSKAYDTEGGTMTGTIFGEAYANFGIRGVAGVLFLYGFFLQHLTAHFVNRQWRTTSTIAIWVSVAYALAASTIDGIGEQLFVALLWGAIIAFAVSTLRQKSVSQKPDLEGEANLPH